MTNQCAVLKPIFVATIPDMAIKIFQDYERLSQEAANEIVNTVKQKPNAVLCLATGDTPRLTYEIMVEKVNTEKVDFSKVTFVALDEWVGIPPANAGSCFFFLNNNVFKPLGINSQQTHLFDALSKDLPSECAKMDSVIGKKGGIDLMLVGVGMNAHVGFNEPGVREDLKTHVVELDATTQSVGQKYFHQTTKLKHGITLGLAHFLNSRKALMLASGKKKAEVMRQALEGPISTAVPASIVRKHTNAIVMLDEDAASLLKA